MKIWNIDELEKIVFIRAPGLRYVLCHGVFDVLHRVHLEHLAWAKSLGDVLIVSVTPDSCVSKGPGRPFFKQEHRMAQLEALSCVDYVVACEAGNAVEIISRLKPQIYAKGVDVKEEPGEGLKAEMATVASYGGKVVFGPEVSELHSSDILKAKGLE